MRTITGIFTDARKATTGALELQKVLGKDHVNLLVPEPTKSELDEVATTEDMAPVGGAMGGTVGAALGASIALAVPGIGPVTAVGLAAAAALGTLGGVAGYKLGDKADRVASIGLPVDELYYYKDALEHGRLVVFAEVEEEGDEAEVRRILCDNGATSLDAARKEWSIGLQDAAEIDYEKSIEDDSRKGS